MKLKEWRLSKGKTQKELAESLGANQGMVQKWENNIVVPTNEFMLKIVNLTDKEVQPNDFYEVENRIKEVRKEKNLTQSQLANAVGVSQGAIQFWENGEREPSLKILKKISEILNCEPWELLPQDMLGNTDTHIYEIASIYRDVKMLEQGIIEVEKNLLNLLGKEIK